MHHDAVVRVQIAEAHGASCMFHDLETGSCVRQGVFAIHYNTYVKPYNYSAVTPLHCDSKQGDGNVGCQGNFRQVPVIALWQARQDS